ncbi:efflux RND transporter periplasmic adaptor subunit [Paenibacillus validus]|uniref:Efflux RND transporter periplasmic adaptor subunit n=1 Tax=Paenibacillus validus TaxID=44253 RepID=A0A7X3CUY8_9BACL|nr:MULTISPECIES: efflux RND transporter periplasmic adaptor subunit [Paenibacillus]MED4600180.1 efflux RND transporter periplasmic adaptor subunit [Paenibacillus validus]MED4607648.1 efflux RND transporter periplasmic adaptor subunit [Paenibacillus validus]MUG72654.1 efflux RND transporter periplasmic adaptor subunit [Paenibacillus validus]
MNSTMKSTLKHSTKVAGAVVICTALIAGCSAQPAAQPTAANAAESQLKVVKVSPVEKKKIGDPLEQVADVVASVQMDVITKVNGDVLEILKKRGDVVEKGDVLFRLDPTDLQISKEKAQIALNGSQQQLAKTRKDLADGKQDMVNGIAKLEAAVRDTEKTYNKMRNDYDLGLVTKFQLEQLETQLNNLKLDLESSRQKLKTFESTNQLAQLEQGVQTADVTVRELERSLNNTEVKATASGVLTDLPVEIGMTLSPGFKGATIQQLDPVKIKAELTEEAAQLIRGKQELEFYVPGETERAKAKVVYLADVMGAQSKSYALELEVANADRKLKPGMKAQVLLTDDNDQVVVTVPTLSVVREGSETFVFVLVGDTAEKRKVELGRLNETIQEIISGVKEGEQLIVSGQNQLKDKEKVQLAK